MLRTDNIAAWRDTSALQIAARAHLPTGACDEAEIVAFRSPDDMREHVALVIGARSAERVPLVRLHSECLTGDAFFSQKCDCGAQLDHAKQLIARDAGVPEQSRQQSAPEFLVVGNGEANERRGRLLEDDIAQKAATVWKYNSVPVTACGF